MLETTLQCSLAMKKHKKHKRIYEVKTNFRQKVLSGCRRHKMEDKEKLLWRQQRQLPEANAHNRTHKRSRPFSGLIETPRRQSISTHRYSRTRRFGIQLITATQEQARWELS